MNNKDFKNKVLSLSERIYPMVVRMLGSESNAQDAIQDIMIKLWDKRKQLNKHPNIKGFVILTARNHCLDCIKKQKLPMSDVELPLINANAATGLEQMKWKELNTIIDEILISIPEQQKQVMTMRDIDGYEFIEIAATLELNVRHVRVLLSRARREVGKQLQTLYGYEYGG